jgi:shikimate kinase
MKDHKTNIVLIGMPGSGKSTVGVILAKMLAKSFLDTDILIQNEEMCTLQEIVDNRGHMALREVEERVLLSVACKDTIIATGGSAAYSERAMRHLQRDGTVVFLHAELAALERRVRNYHTRGLAKRPEQSFEDLFTERLQLYCRYAEIVIESSLLTQEEVCEWIIKELHARARCEGWPQRKQPTSTVTGEDET